MSLTGKPIDQITQADLQALVDNQEPESRVLEYKKQLPASRDQDKSELRADVTALANTSGGHIIYGIDESTDVAERLVGLDLSNPDAEILRLEQTLEYRVSPRIPGLQTRAISLSTGKVAVVQRVPRSFARPHAVLYGDATAPTIRFWARTSTGKTALDVDQVRLAFQQSDITERIRNFRRDRLAGIIAGETPVLVSATAKIVIHVIPLDAYEAAARIDVSQCRTMSPLYSGGWNWRLNFDGLVTFRPNRQGALIETYLQVYRNGILEAVDTGLLAPRQSPPILLIPSIAYEQEIISVLTGWLEKLQQLDVQMPVVVMLSLLGVKGYSMSTGDSYRGQDQDFNIDRDELLVPEILLESYEVDLPGAFRPAFDAVWNACGYQRSLNYDDAGLWKPQR